MNVHVDNDDNTSDLEEPTMTARPRKTVTPPAPIVADQPAAEFSLDSLAAAAKPIADLPKSGARPKANPLAALVQLSRDSAKAYELPPVSDDAAARTVRYALLGAGRSLGLSVSVRNTRTDDGIVVSFLATDKAGRE